MDLSGGYPLLVFCCTHVFRRHRPVLRVLRWGGDWQFSCGHAEDDAASGEPIVVSVKLLLDADESLKPMLKLDLYTGASRAALAGPWSRFHLSPTE